MTKREISQRQKLILDYIRRCRLEHDEYPTRRMIGAACNIPSTSTVNYHLNILARLGYISLVPDHHRGIRLSHLDDEIRAVERGRILDKAERWLKKRLLTSREYNVVCAVVLVDERELTPDERDYVMTPEFQEALRSAIDERSIP